MSLPADDADRDLLVDPAATSHRARRVMVAGGLLIAFMAVATFVYGQWRAEAGLHEQLLLQARAFTKEIVATRQYVARHGGVYVPETQETTLNPYLNGVPGLRTRIRDESGTVYVLQNPSLVVREINTEFSALPGTRARFHMASDRPLNPHNRADAFEAEALAAFAAGASEHERLFRDAERSQYRYVMPLEVAPECVRCHARQGWAPGEIAGGISVAIDAREVDRAIRDGRAYTAAALAGSLGTLLLVLYLLLTNLLGSLLAAETRLRQMATTDPLTGLANRRAAMQRLAGEVERAQRADAGLGVLMLDLDRFKRINDTAGHAVGDAVLAAAAEGMASEARGYDTVARIGGEEFLVILPGASEAEAMSAAERIRDAVVRRTGAVAGVESPVTASAGVAARLQGEHESAGDLLRRADRALYRAKDAGRDRSERG